MFDILSFVLVATSKIDHAPIVAKNFSWEANMLKFAVVAVCAILSSAALAAEAKVTVLYGEPKNAEEFDKYYSETHMPMVYAVKEVKRVEISKPLPPPSGGKPLYYTLTELWFDSLDTFKAVAATPEWKAIAADVPKFASGGATVFVSVIETKR